MALPAGRRTRAHAKFPASPCACDVTRRAARALTHLYSNAMDDVGVSVTQLGILREAAVSGPLLLADLPRIMVLDKTSLHRALAPMVRDGWFEVTGGPLAGKAGRRMALTAKGRSVLGEAARRWNTVQDRIAATMGPARWSMADEVMTELIEACAQLGDRRR